MFTHLLAGSLIFLFLGNYFGLEVNGLFLFIGASFGILPDAMGAILRWDLVFYKWTHKHRDDIFHSVFFPVIAFIVVLVLYGFELALMVGLAVLSHTFLDITGVGWGVKLFYPINKLNYKLFSRGKLLQVWSGKELNKLLKKNHEPKWFFKILFTFNCLGVPWWYGVVEWLSLVFFILLVFLY